MKATDIISRLQEVLPTLVKGFSDELTAASLSHASGTATMTFGAGHGFSVGDVLAVSGAVSQLPISSLSQSGGVATAVCSAPHDLTTGESLTVTLSGATEPEYNGTFQVDSIGTSTTFRFIISASAPAVATGSPVLEESRDFGFNGRFAVASVPDATTLTYALTPEAAANLPANATGTITVYGRFRISGGADFDRLLLKYTQRTKTDAVPSDNSWLFVVLGALSVSRDRNTKSDNVASFSSNVYFSQTMTQAFSIYAFVPRVKSMAGRDIRDMMEGLRAALIGSVVGQVFPSGLATSSDYRTVYAGDDQEEIDSAVYVHGFQFEQPFWVTETDLVSSSKSVALRNVDLGLTFNTETITVNGIEVTP